MKRWNPLKDSTARRRTGFSLFVGIVTALVLGTSLGFASASTSASEARPNTWEVATPSVGDRVEYRAGVTYADGSSSDEVVLATFGWSEDRRTYTYAGQPRVANVLGQDVLDHEQTEGGIEWVSQVDTYLIDASSKAMFVRVAPQNEREVDDEGNIRTSNGTTAYYHAEPGLRQQPTCLALNAFQRGSVALDSPVRVFDAPCSGLRSPTPSDVEYWLPMERDFEYAGIENIAGYEAIELVGERWTGTIRVWFAQEIPYPLLLTLEGSSSAPEGAHSYVRLAGFEAGHTPVAASGESSGDHAPELQWVEPTPWGFNDDGVSHDFPLSEAYARALKDPEYTEFRKFVDSHSGAFASYIRYDTYEQQGHDPRHVWVIGLTDGKDGVKTCVYKETKNILDGWSAIPPEYRPEQTKVVEYRAESCWDPDIVPRHAAPTQLPTPQSLHALWRAYASDDHVEADPNSYELSISCEDAGCDDPRIIIGGGYQRSARTYESDSQLDAGGQSYYHDAYGFLTLDSAIDALIVSEYVHDTIENPRQPSPAWPSQEDVTIASIDTRAAALWAMPSRAQVMGAGVAGLLAGLAYWVWPAIKTGGGLAMFSRVEKPKALDHQGRARIMSAVEAEPGIHYREVVRRTGLGRSTVKHHLGKLEHVGLVTSRRGRGYTSYFPAGAVDRRAMHAIANAKGDGARRLLKAAHERPGCSAGDLALRLGMSKPTVSFHLARLHDAGLLNVERRGRVARVYATEQALHVV